MSITVKLEAEDAIELPASIATAKLTLAELGTLVVFACMGRGVVPSVELLSDPECNVAFAKLQKQGVIVAKRSGKTLRFTIDLDRLEGIKS